MKKYRIRFFLAVLAALIAAFVTDSSAIMAAFAVLAVLPVFMKLLLNFGISGLSVKAEVSEGGKIGEDLGLKLYVEKKKWLLAPGALIINVSFKNAFMAVKEQKSFYVPVKSGKEGVNLPFSPKLCGKIKISFESVRMCGLLGLFDTEIDPPQGLAVTVYPNTAGLQVLRERAPSGCLGGEVSDGSKKGIDSSEFFDLRAYREGDSMRMIHWKLSVKLNDELIIRELSSSFNFDTLLYIDMGTHKNGERIKPENLSALAEAGVSFGGSMTRAGMAYHMAMPSKTGLYTSAVSDINDYVRTVEEIMSLSATDDSSELLERIYTREVYESYGRLICFVWNEYPAVLERLSEFIDVTVVIIYEHGKTRQAAERDKIHIVALPDDEIYNKTYTVSL